MSAAEKPPIPMSLEMFIAGERQQDARYEFDGARPVAITGGTIAHSEIATNIALALRRKLRGTPCRAVRGDVKILVAGRARYPDVAVTCTPYSSASDILPDPVVVFEVLSRSTAFVDRIAKNHEDEVTPRRPVCRRDTTMNRPGGAPGCHI